MFADAVIGHDAGMRLRHGHKATAELCYSARVPACLQLHPAAAKGKQVATACPTVCGATWKIKFDPIGVPGRVDRSSGDGRCAFLMRTDAPVWSGQIWQKSPSKHMQEPAPARENVRLDSTEVALKSAPNMQVFRFSHSVSSTACIEARSQEAACFHTLSRLPVHAGEKTLTVVQGYMSRPVVQETCPVPCMHQCLSAQLRKQQSHAARAVHVALESEGSPRVATHVCYTNPGLINPKSLVNVELQAVCERKCPWAQPKLRA